MVKVGITGGIGSGKTTVCKFFEILGIPVFTADTEAKTLMNSSSLIRDQLVLTFGDHIYLPNRSLDRKKLAQLIFDSPDLLEKVNSIVHPEVRTHFLRWVAKQSSPYIVYEAAIMFESGFYTMMDFNILVTAPEEVRIERVMAREDTTRADVKRRISRQWADPEKIKRADYILNNNNEELIIPQLIELDKKFRTHG
ncbi:MAG: dephospho-CoA kinase [Bacteroidales bacterium]|jgi:dephospho-CoA kinase